MAAAKSKLRLTPDLGMARRYLAALDANAQAFSFSTFPDGQQDVAPTVAHGRLDTLADKLASLNSRGCGVFVTVNATDLKGRKKSNILRVRAVWQEDDDAWNGDLPLFPSIIVQSSPGKLHRYWAVDGLGIEDHRPIMERMVRDFGSDKNAKDEARVLRLPGFYHCKREPHLVELIEASGIIYDAAEILDAFPPWREEIERPSPRSHPRPTPTQADELEKAREALKYVAADNYDEWYRIGAILQKTFGAAGRGLWDEWSSASGAKFKVAAQDKKWQQIANIEKLSLGSIFYKARQGGFRFSQQRIAATSRTYERRQEEKPKLAETITPDIADLWQRDKNEELLKNRHNALLAFKTMGIKLSHDAFAQENRIEGLEDHGPHLNDAAMRALYLLIWDEYGLKYRKEDLDAIVREACWRNRFHPVRAYLDSLVWDGMERIDEWLITYAGANDTLLVRAYGRLFLIAAVRRARQPGCKFDEMLVLEGPEGVRKSTAMRVLAGEDWFSDDAPFGAPAREVIEKMRGRWIIECAELDAMRKSEVTAVKRFLSSQSDASTLKYERETTKAPRQCVFVGTTNEAAYLLSSTGNRRFWPVPVAGFDLDSLQRDRDQLWAEAAWLEAKGASIRLDPSLYASGHKEQERRRITDPWRDTLEEALGSLQGKVASSDLWKLLDRDQKSKRTQADNMRLGQAMRELGWGRPESGIKMNGRRVNGYVKGQPKYLPLRLDSAGTAFETVLFSDSDDEE